MKSLIASFVCLATLVLNATQSHAAPSSPTGSVQIGWSYDFVGNPTVTGFNIYVGTNSGSIPNWDGTTNPCVCYQSIIPTTSTNTTATITGLTRGLTYYITVTPTSPTDEGDYCNEVRAAIPSKPAKASSLVIIHVN